MTGKPKWVDVVRTTPESADVTRVGLEPSAVRWKFPSIRGCRARNPFDSTPATPPPEEEPETSDPPDGDEPVDEGGPPETEPDDDVNPAVVTAAVAGFVVLVGIAAWWMFRRDDPDADIGHADPHDWPDQQMSL